MSVPIDFILLNQSPWAPIDTTMMYGNAKLAALESRWSIYSGRPFYDVNSLLNPQIAIDQVATKLKGNGTNFVGDYFGNSGFVSGAGSAGNGGQFKFDFSKIVNGGTGVTNPATAGTVEGGKVAVYKNALDSLTKKFPFTEEQRNKYNEALKKTTDAEKLAAFKELFNEYAKDIEKSDITAAILEIDSIKTELKKAGYFYSENQAGSGVKLDEATANEVDSLIHDADGGIFISLAQNCKANNNIIEVLSYWNDSHNDNDNRCILRYVAKNLADANYSAGMANIVIALKSAAKEFSSSPAISQKVAALDKAYDNHLKQAITEYNGSAVPRSAEAKKKFENAIMKFAPYFEDLYIQIRMEQAAKIDANVSNLYGKELNSAISGCVDETAVQAATKNDLEKEGFNGKVPSVKINNSNSGNNQNNNKLNEDFKNDAAGMLAASATSEYGSLTKETDCEGVYVSNTGDNVIPVFYTVKDGKAVILNGVSDIDSDGNCTMFDGTSKKLEDILKDNNATKTVTSEKMTKYNEASQKVDELIDSEKIKVKSNLKVAGMKVYYSTEKDDNGQWQYFIIKNGELVRLKNVKSTMNSDGKIKLGSETVSIKDLKPSQYETFKDSMLGIEEEDNTEETDNNENNNSVINDEEGTLNIESAGVVNIDDADKEAKAKGYSVLSVSGYYSKKSGNKVKYYVYDNGEFTELKNVTKINEDGTAIKKVNGKEVKISLREVGISASSAGKALRESLYGDTSSDDYNCAKRQLNSFFTYDDPEEIYDFLKNGYRETQSWFCLRNSRIATQIVTEGGLTKDEKKEYIKKLASKTIKMAEKAGIGKNENIRKELSIIAQKGSLDVSLTKNNFWRNNYRANEVVDWVKSLYIPGFGISKIATLTYTDGDNNLYHTAKILDSIIYEVEEKYEESKGETKTEEQAAVDNSALDINT